MDQCSPVIAQIKEVFGERAEVPATEVIAKLSLHNTEELEKTVASSMIYELSKDKQTVTKKPIIRFKMIMLRSSAEVVVPVGKFVEALTPLFPNLPYVRFNKTSGHLVVFEEDFLRHENVYGKSISVTSDDQKEHSVALAEPTFDDRRAFSSDHSKHMEGILRHKYGKQTHFAVDGVTVYKNGIYLGVQKFKSIKELQTYFGKLLKSSEEGKPLPEAEANCLRELLKYHVNSEKKLVEIDHFEVGLHPKFTETKCFLIVKKDGTKEDFSFNKCVKQIGNLIK